MRAASPHFYFLLSKFLLSLTSALRSANGRIRRVRQRTDWPWRGELSFASSQPSAAVGIFASQLAHISRKFKYVIMRDTLDQDSRVARRVQAAIRLRKQIDRLERKFAELYAHVPKYVLARNDYGFTADEMKRIAQKLHGKAKQRIASGRSKAFRGSIEAAL